MHIWKMCIRDSKNIVLAANQAKDLTKDKDIIVIPTKTVPQGITAIINYMPEEDVDTNMETMLEEIKNVKTGQVTYAVRDTHIDDKEIHEGDIMGIGDAGILSVGQSVEQTTKEMLSQLVDDDTELISLYYGQDVLEEDVYKRQTLVSPYHMALITQAIANGGTLMEPYLVDKVTNYKGTEIRKNVPKSYKKLMTSEEASQLKDYMRAVVDEGTATMLSGQSYSVAGKTGTAEYLSLIHISTERKKKQKEQRNKA